MKIIINNNLYDITEFINEHPGGNHVFKNGSDMTEEFNAVGHSKEAIEMLKNYIVEKKLLIENKTMEDKMIHIENISICDFLYIKFKNSKLSKLVTREDYLHIHKVLGFITLLNCMYSIFDLLYSGCKGIFTIRQVDMSFFMLLTIQLLLSLSSLQFIVPLDGNYTTISIGEEYRLHSILFAVRHFLAILILHFLENNILSHALISTIVLSNMYFAHVVSIYYKPSNNKLGFKIGSIPFWSNCNSYIQDTITNVYSIAQVYSTFMLITGQSNIEYNHYIMFVIQITAFMTTLSKKGIINNIQWHFIYLSEYTLFIVTFINNYNIFNLQNVITTLTLWYLRTNISMNKFFLWTCVSVIVMFTTYFKNNICLVTSLVLLSSICNHYQLCFDKKREKNHNTIYSNITIEHTNLHLIHIHLIHVFQYNSGQYFNLYIDKEKRPYNPISHNKKDNIISFLIKNYKNNNISEKICSLKNNMCIHIDGPFGNNYYDKPRDLLICNNKIVDKTNIIMFYCGTGVTPFYGILKSINQSSKYTFTVFGSLHDTYENNFKDIVQTIFYSNDKLTPEKINNIMSPYNSDNTAILLCGTKSYNNMIINTIQDAFTIYKW